MVKGSSSSLSYSVCADEQIFQALFSANDPRCDKRQSLAAIKTRGRPGFCRFESKCDRCLQVQGARFANVLALVFDVGQQVGLLLFNHFATNGEVHGLVVAAGVFEHIALRCFGQPAADDRGGVQLDACRCSSRACRLQAKRLVTLIAGLLGAEVAFKTEALKAAGGGATEGNQSSDFAYENIYH